MYTLLRLWPLCAEESVGSVSTLLNNRDWCPVMDSANRNQIWYCQIGLVAMQASWAVPECQMDKGQLALLAS